MTYALAFYVFIVGDLFSLEQNSFNEIILLRERLKEEYMKILEDERIFSVLSFLKLKSFDDTYIVTCYTK